MVEPSHTDSEPRRIPMQTHGHLSRIAGLLLLGVLAGCRTTAIPTDLSVTTPMGPAQPRFSIPAVPKRLVRRASIESESPAARTLTPLTLGDAIAMSLERNPDLAAVRASEPVAAAAYQVAKTYPWNPQFQTQTLPYSQDRNGRDGTVSQQHAIVQTFELAGQRGFRRGASAARWQQVTSTIRQAERMNIAQTTRLFFTAIYLRELRDMSRSLADLNEQLVGVIERRLDAGQARHADVQLTRLQARSSRRKQRLAEATFRAALISLRNQLNLDANTRLDLPARWAHSRWRSVDDLVNSRPKQSPSGTAGDGPATEPDSDAAPVPPIDDATLDQLVAERPDVIAARAAVEMASENLRLANAMRRPNLQIGPIWQRDEAATEFWGVQAQIDIPVVNTGVPLVRQRAAELRQQQVTAVQLEKRAVLQSRAAIRRYERARRLVDQSRDDFEDTIPDALKPFEDQFKAGQITLLEVFAARSALVQSRQGFLDLLNELALAAADVTQAIGVPAQQLMTKNGPAAVPLEEAPKP